MGHAPDWMRQNMKGSGMSKIGKPGHKDTGNPFHGPNAVKNGPLKSGRTPTRRMADGGYVSENWTPPDEPSGERVGFFERLKAGNIDEPGSEAYNRWGKGSVNEREAEKARLERQAKVTSSKDADWEANMGQGKQPTRPEYETKKTASDYDEIRKESYRSEKGSSAGSPSKKSSGAKSASEGERKSSDSYPDESARGVKTSRERSDKAMESNDRASRARRKEASLWGDLYEGAKDLFSNKSSARFRNYR